METYASAWNMEKATYFVKEFERGEQLSLFRIFFSPYSYTPGSRRTKA